MTTRKVTTATKVTKSSLKGTLPVRKSKVAKRAAKEDGSSPAGDELEEGEDLIGEDPSDSPDPRAARRPQAPQPEVIQMVDDLAFASGLFAGKGKMLFQVTCNAERIIAAVRAAAERSFDPERVKIKVLENVNGNAHAWLAFSPLSEEPPARPQGQRQEGYNNDRNNFRSGSSNSSGRGRGGYGGSGSGGSFRGGRGGNNSGGGRGRYQGDSWNRQGQAPSRGQYERDEY